MKKSAILTCAAVFSLISTVGIAHEYKIDNLLVEHPTVRLTISSRPAAGYMVIHNMGDTSDRLISASSSAAKHIELHRSIMKDGIMKMRPVKGVDIPAKSQVAFKSGGYHLMVFGLKAGTKAGDKIPLTVVFKNAGAVNMTAYVEKLVKKKMKMSE